jgi:hypothetical protein
VGEAIQSVSKSVKTKVMGISRQPSRIQIMVDRVQLENVKYFSYFGSMISDISSIPKIASEVSMAN